MNKEIFKLFLTNALEEKNALMAQNSISEEDKALIQGQIDNLTEIMGKVDALEEGENTQALIDELKATVTDLSDKLTALNEKINQANKELEDTEMTENEYLKSQNAVRDFAEAIRKSANRGDFLKNWADVLATNGITIAEGSEEGYLPEYVKSRIQTIWDDNADWLKSLNIVGAKRYQIRKLDSEQSASDSRAKGWKKGQTKTSQELQFSAKEVTCQFIYKLQEISLEDEWNDDGSLIDFIIKELVDQILFEEKQAVLVGDGRAANAVGKIDKIEAIARTTSDAYVTVNTATDGFVVDDLRTLCDTIHNPNGKEIFCFMSKETLRTLSRVQASSESTPVYLSTEQCAEQIGASRIITTDLLGADYKAVAFIPSAYVMIGDNVLNPVLFKFHSGYENIDVYRYEVVVGGSVEGLKSAAVLKNA